MGVVTAMRTPDVSSELAKKGPMKKKQKIEKVQPAALYEQRSASDGVDGAYYTSEQVAEMSTETKRACFRMLYGVEPPGGSILVIECKLLGLPVPGAGQF